MIATPDRKVLSGTEVKSVTLPGGKGEMTVLPGHADLISTIGVGILSFETDSGKKETAAIAHGFVQIKNDEVSILAERVEMSNEIDIERAKRAEEKAQEALKAKGSFEEDHQKWVAKLDRARMRQLAAQYLPKQ